ncbi:hypothetical protein F1559_000263 [Cyanidiococcus yangmingshanensis]|uniref:Uncharacterized protein n=1 Tax=Cyanidiococcus yangmingshanensis TaxID=2690220 RepID=A0A7J7IJF9_9RHOD|nr:hypothetical protein F1559_000263 [Cyanidiococcus yangmingshanensis]
MHIEGADIRYCFTNTESWSSPKNDLMVVQCAMLGARFVLHAASRLHSSRHEHDRFSAGYPYGESRSVTRAPAGAIRFLRWPHSVYSFFREGLQPGSSIIFHCIDQRILDLVQIALLCIIYDCSLSSVYI